MLARLGKWKSPRIVELLLKLAAYFNPEFRWAVATGMWVHEINRNSYAKCVAIR